MADFQELLNDPDYQSFASDPGKQMEIRRSFYRNNVVKDPDFQSLPLDRRHVISRGILFPGPEPEVEPARPKPSIAEAAKQGWERMKTPNLTTAPYGDIGNQVLGAMQIAGSPLQPAANLVTTAGERVSDYLDEKGYPKLGTAAGALTTGVGDYATGVGAAKALNLLKAPLARALPTVKEKLGLLDTEKATRLAANEKAAYDAQLAAANRARTLPLEQEQKISDLDRLASEAQARVSAGQEARLQQIPGAKAAVEQRGVAGLDKVRSDLAAQQRTVGQEAAQAVAPAGPKRTNFKGRYGKALQVADQHQTQPVNLNAAAFGVRREGGVAALPTQAERGASGTAQLLTEGALPEVEEEIGSAVRRALTQGTELKPTDYKAITIQVLGNATADNVSVGTLLRTEKRLRAAQRAAYGAGPAHKNLGRQFGDLEEAVAKDIADASKANPTVKKAVRISRAADKDWQKKVASEWYAEGVDQSFNPATGAWDRKRFTKWFENHTDVTNNDRDLRRLLGDRYDDAKGLVKDMQEASVKNIEQVAREAARGARLRTKEELRAVGQREKDLGAFGKEIETQIKGASKEGRAAIEEEFAAKQKMLPQTEKQIAEARDKTAKAIEKEIETGIEKATGKPWHLAGGRFWGSVALVHGVVTGNPYTAIGGLGTIITHAGINKLLASAQGASVLRRAIRAAPGTGEAIAASSAIGRLLNEGEKKESAPSVIEQATPRPTAAPTDSAAKKAALLKRYGIQ